jgi:hypothetical protein
VNECVRVYMMRWDSTVGDGEIECEGVDDAVGQ